MVLQSHWEQRETQQQPNVIHTGPMVVSQRKCVRNKHKLCLAVVLVVAVGAVGLGIYFAGRHVLFIKCTS